METVQIVKMDRDGGHYYDAASRTFCNASYFLELRNPYGLIAYAAPFYVTPNGNDEREIHGLHPDEAVVQWNATFTGGRRNTLRLVTTHVGGMAELSRKEMEITLNFTGLTLVIYCRKNRDAKTAHLFQKSWGQPGTFSNAWCHSSRMDVCRPWPRERRFSYFLLVLWCLNKLLALAKIQNHSCTFFQNFYPWKGTSGCCSPKWLGQKFRNEVFGCLAEKRSTWRFFCYLPFRFAPEKPRVDPKIHCFLGWTWGHWVYVGFLIRETQQPQTLNIEWYVSC